MILIQRGRTLVQKYVEYKISKAEVKSKSKLKSTLKAKSKSFVINSNSKHWLNSDIHVLRPETLQVGTRTVESGGATEEVGTRTSAA
ncbi:hypothetical protein L6452_35781 [Arctium lappa]|uniref:Uncharacterized protein n=1 Tax=Arctium lappa TaxID=4217 RepID=A0ACB8Y8A0_ARCLA|nr:hypothetical protein L6452_35781 [Arctium lappa]